MSSKSASFWIKRIMHQTVPIERIIAHPDNPHKHPESQIRELRGSYRQFGQFRELVLIENELTNGMIWCVAGSGTLQAMREEGATTVEGGFLPPETPPLVVKGIMAADNLLSRKGIDDTQRLAALLDEQSKSGVDLTILGSSEQALTELWRTVLNAQAADFLKVIPSPSRSAPFEPFPVEPAEQAPAYTPTPSYPPAEESLPLAAPVQLELFPVTYTLTKEQRDIVLEAIKEAKTSYHVGLSSEAIVHICNAFLQQRRAA